MSPEWWIEKEKIESNFAGHKLRNLNEILRDLKQVVRRTRQPGDEKKNCCWTLGKISQRLKMIKHLLSKRRAAARWVR